MSKDCEKFAEQVRKSQEISTYFVAMGKGAFMQFPTDQLAYQTRYYPKDLPTMLIASALDSYRYLVLECNKDEAWRRIKRIRRHVKEAQESEQISAIKEGE